MPFSWKFPSSLSIHDDPSSFSVDGGLDAPQGSIGSIPRDLKLISKLSIPSFRFFDGAVRLLLNLFKSFVRNVNIHSSQPNVDEGENRHYPLAVREPRMRFLPGFVLLSTGFLGSLACGYLYGGRRLAVCMGLRSTIFGSYGLGVPLSVY